MKRKNQYRKLKERKTCIGCIGTFQFCTVFLFDLRKRWNIPKNIFGISKSFLPVAGDVTGPSGTGQIKTGAPCRSERLAKYNQLWLVGLWWFLGKDVTGEMNMVAVSHQGSERSKEFKPVPWRSVTSDWATLRLLIFCWTNMFLIPVTNHGAN